MGNLDIRTLRASAIEHAMRSTSNVTLVEELRHTEPGSREALRALGQLMSHAWVDLTANSPLVAFCRSGELDESWREKVKCSEQNLYGELEMLRILYPQTTQAADPLEELLNLRQTADSDIIE
jgi:hypothetical protein